MSESQVGANREPLDASASTLEIVSRVARDGAADARDAAEQSNEAEVSAPTTTHLN